MGRINFMTLYILENQNSHMEKGDTKYIEKRLHKSLSWNWNSHSGCNE